VPYPRGFRVPDFFKFTGEDSKTTYEHEGQFLVQVSNFGRTDVNKIRLFPLSLLATTFNWLLSLPANSVDTWGWLEQRFHDYFYNGETKLRLSHLVSIKQKHNESVLEYMCRFRDTRNKCYGLTIAERDLSELAVAGLHTALRDKLEGQDFTDVNQIMQRAIAQENQSKEAKSYGRFRDVSAKDKARVNCVEDG
jgi:hypothetical protein